MKFEKVPLGLKATAQEAISNLIIRALWKNQLHSEASPSSGQHYIFYKKKITPTPLAESFYNVKYESSIIMSEVSQQISVMKT